MASNFSSVFIIRLSACWYFWLSMVSSFMIDWPSLDRPSADPLALEIAVWISSLPSV